MRFENLPLNAPNFSYVGKMMNESDMVISVLAYDEFYQSFIAWNTNDSHYRGSGAIANNNSDGITILSRTNGATFDFVGIDLAGFQTYHQGTVTFHGYRGFAEVANDSFTFVAGGNFQTFTTSRLTNVMEVRWPQSSPAIHQFDNVTVVLNTNLPQAQPVIKFQHLDYDFFDISGLQVGRSYALEYSWNLTNWSRQQTFKAYSTINYPGFLAYPVSSNRFYRVRSL